MNRNDFLKKIGAGAAFTLTAPCLGGCAVENIAPDVPAAAVDFTLDLNSPNNVSLSNKGGYVVVNGNVVVGKAMDGSFVAATRKCSHEPRNEVVMRNNEWYCTAHGAKFSLGGRGLNGNGSNGLTIYNTELTGNILRVFS